MSAYSREELAGLYRRRVGMVYQICLMLLKNAPDAEDVTQTVFRKALERTEPFRDLEHEKAWLIVTARNECRNQLKHWWRTRRSGEEELETIPWEEQGTGKFGRPCSLSPRGSVRPSTSTITRATAQTRRRSSWAQSPPPCGPGSSGPGGN